MSIYSMWKNSEGSSCSENYTPNRIRLPHKTFHTSYRHGLQEYTSLENLTFYKFKNFFSKRLKIIDRFEIAKKIFGGRSTLILIVVKKFNAISFLKTISFFN